MIRSVLFAIVTVALTACGDPAQAPATREGAGLPAQAAAGLPALDADGLPRFRPGLWEVVTNDGEESAPSRQCLGDQANAELREALKAGDSPNCRRTRSVSIAGLTVKASCDQGAARADLAIRLTGHDTAYTLTMDLASTTADGARHADRIEGKARWLGPCPPGMKPGDDVSDSANL